MHWWCHHTINEVIIINTVNQLTFPGLDKIYTDHQVEIIIASGFQECVHNWSSLSVNFEQDSVVFYFMNVRGNSAHPDVIFQQNKTVFQQQTLGFSCRKNCSIFPWDVCWVTAVCVAVVMHMHGVFAIFVRIQIGNICLFVCPCHLWLRFISGNRNIRSSNNRLNLHSTFSFVSGQENGEAFFPYTI